MSQTGPRDIESVFASRYTLTEKGVAAVDELDDDHPWANALDESQHALLDAAVAWDRTKPECDVVEWLRARVDGCTCGDPHRCLACSAFLCVACSVGEPSRCEHQDGPLCLGCDVEYCATCRREVAEDRFDELVVDLDREYAR